MEGCGRGGGGCVVFLGAGGRRWTVAARPLSCGVAGGHAGGGGSQGNRVTGEGLGKFRLCDL